MLRTPNAICSSAMLLAIITLLAAILAAAPAPADELPMRKAGYWEMKAVMGGNDVPPGARDIVLHRLS